MTATGPALPSFPRSALIACGTFLFVTGAWIIWFLTRGDSFIQAVFDAAAFAVFTTPLFASLVMPRPAYLALYPAAVLAGFAVLNIVGPLLPPATAPGAATDEPMLMCGMPALALIAAVVIGLVFGVAGRAIGFWLHASGRRGLLVYLAQLAPFAVVLTWGLLSIPPAMR